MNLSKILKEVDWIRGEIGYIPKWADAGIKHGFCGIEGQPSELHHLKQIHSSIIKEADRETQWQFDDIRPEGDAIFTDSDNLRVSIKTADCVPILFLSKNGIMALHGGWRGLSKGILEQAILFFRQKGISACQLSVGIGPCISLSQFEIGEEVVEKLQQGVRSLGPLDWAYCLSKGQKDRWHIDLAMIAVFELAHLGVVPAKISVLQSCTYLHDKSWHSYRRSGEKAGRNWSWIGF